MRHRATICAHSAKPEGGRSSSPGWAILKQPPLFSISASGLKRPFHTRRVQHFLGFGLLSGCWFFATSLPLIQWLDGLLACDNPFAAICTRIGLQANRDLQTRLQMSCHACPNKVGRLRKPSLVALAALV